MKFEETGDKIVIIQRKTYRFFYSGLGGLSIFCIIIGSLAVGSLLLAPPESFGALITNIIFVGIFIFGGIYFLDSLFDITITVDRTFKLITLKKDSFLKLLSSFKEIPFSDIKEIRIEHSNAETEYWAIYLIKNSGKYELIIIGDYSESRIREIADKISILAGKETTFKDYA
jgi:hypothetical protein